MAPFPITVVAGILFIVSCQAFNHFKNTNTANCGVLTDQSVVDEGSGDVASDSVKSGITWPWQVTILIPQHDGSDLMCGGALISDRFVVSAASCFYPGSLSPWAARLIEIRLGMQNIWQRAPGEQRRGVFYLYTNQSNPTKKAQGENDIILLRLSRPVTFTNSIRPICLPGQGTEPFGAGDKVHSSWNFDFMDAEGKNNIVWGHKDATITSLEACQSSYPSGLVTENMICANGFKRTANLTCEGNSGSPLFYEASNVFYLIGITSWSQGCALPNRPHVYTRVSKYLDWIEKKVFPVYYRPRASFRSVVRKGKGKGKHGFARHHVANH